jgi:membrane protein required for colicin V production
MTWFDYAVLAVLGLSATIGVWRGLVREVFALAAWIAAALVTMLFAGEVTAWLPASFTAPLVRTVIAVVALFVGVLVAVSLGGVLVSKLARAVGLSLADRTLGGVFGIARGALILLVLVLAAGLTALPKEPFWREARLSAPLETAAIAVRPYLPRAVADRVRYER